MRLLAYFQKSCSTTSATASTCDHFRFKQVTSPPRFKETGCTEWSRSYCKIRATEMKDTVAAIFGKCSLQQSVFWPQFVFLPCEKYICFLPQDLFCISLKPVFGWLYLVQLHMRLSGVVLLRYSSSNIGLETGE